MARSRVTVGAAIRERRERLGILQAELAQRVGVSASYLCRIEADVERPGLGTQTVHRLAKELGVSLDYITEPLAQAVS